MFPYREQRCLIRPEASRGSTEVLCEDTAGGWQGGVTWSAQLAVLLLLASVHPHAPGVEGEGEEVLQARGRAHNSVQALQPFLTLLKGGELTPVDPTQKTTVHLDTKFYCSSFNIDIYFLNGNVGGSCTKCMVLQSHEALLFILIVLLKR